MRGWVYFSTFGYNMLHVFHYGDSLIAMLTYCTFYARQAFTSVDIPLPLDSADSLFSHIHYFISICHCLQIFFNLYRSLWFAFGFHKTLLAHFLSCFAFHSNNSLFIWLLCRQLHPYFICHPYKFSCILLTLLTSYFHLYI